jgi:hypothetical protein
VINENLFRCSVSLLKNKTMKIERTKNEVIIRVPASVNVDDLQDLTDLIEYKEISRKSKATQEEVDNLVSDIKEGRWEKTKAKLDL